MSHSIQNIPTYYLIRCPVYSWIYIGSNWSFYYEDSSKVYTKVTLIRHKKENILVNEQIIMGSAMRNWIIKGTLLQEKFI
jgi:hypothetical protein